jgi:hypothetical protein
MFGGVGMNGAEFGNEEEMDFEEPKTAAASKTSTEQQKPKEAEKPHDNLTEEQRKVSTNIVSLY